MIYNSQSALIYASAITMENPSYNICIITKHIKENFIKINKLVKDYLIKSSTVTSTEADIVLINNSCIKIIYPHIFSLRGRRCDEFIIDRSVIRNEPNFISECIYLEQAKGE